MSAGGWFLVNVAAVITSMWVQRQFGWMVWGSLMTAFFAVYLLWKLAPL